MTATVRKLNNNEVDLYKGFHRNRLRYIEILSRKLNEKKFRRALQLAILIGHSQDEMIDIKGGAINVYA